MLPVIPDELVLNFLSEWWEMKSIGNLDSAFCNSQNRFWFLMLLPKKRQCFKENTLFCESFNYFKWVSLRKIKLGYLTMFKDKYNCEFHYNDDGFVNFPLDYLEVKSLNIGYFVETDFCTVDTQLAKFEQCRQNRIMVDIFLPESNKVNDRKWWMFDVINHCPKLEILEFGSYTLDAGGWQVEPIVSAEVMRNIKELTLRIEDNPPESFTFKNLTFHCSKLVKLTTNFNIINLDWNLSHVLLANSDTLEDVSWDESEECGGSLCTVLKVFTQKIFKHLKFLKCHTCLLECDGYEDDAASVLRKYHNQFNIFDVFSSQENLFFKFTNVDNIKKFRMNLSTSNTEAFKLWVSSIQNLNILDLCFNFYSQIATDDIIYEYFKTIVKYHTQSLTTIYFRNIENILSFEHLSWLISECKMLESVTFEDFIFNEYDQQKIAENTNNIIALINSPDNCLSHIVLKNCLNLDTQFISDFVGEYHNTQCLKPVNVEFFSNI
jgi:hypothetical protein